MTEKGTEIFTPHELKTVEIDIENIQYVVCCSVPHPPYMKRGAQRPFSYTGV